MTKDIYININQSDRHVLQINLAHAALAFYEIITNIIDVCMRLSAREMR